MWARFNLMRVVLRETLLAFLALSLFCLNLSTASANYGDQSTLVNVQTVALCGDASGAGGDGGHVVCHACRPSIPALPAPPELFVDACLVATPVVHAPDPAASVASVFRLLGPSPRGPPVIA